MADPRSMFDGKMADLVSAIDEFAGVRVMVLACSAEQLGISAPPPMFARTNEGKFIYDADLIVDGVAAPYLNRHYWRVRLVQFTLSNKTGFTESNKSLPFCTDKISVYVVDFCRRLLTTKFAHANRLCAERFMRDPNVDLLGIIIIIGDGQTIESYFKDGPTFSSLNGRKPRRAAMANDILVCVTISQNARRLQTLPNIATTRISRP